jgi:hypothetical protein
MGNPGFCSDLKTELTPRDGGINDQEREQKRKPEQLPSPIISSYAMLMATLLKPEAFSWSLLINCGAAKAVPFQNRNRLGEPRRGGLPLTTEKVRRPR